MTLNEFLVAMPKIAPFWKEADLKAVFNSISKTNTNNTFYVIDFFVLLILYGKATLNQKYSLLFDLISSFDADFSTGAGTLPYINYFIKINLGQLSLSTIKGLTSYLYDVFMIYIPHNQLENMVDLANTGYTSCIKRVVINDYVVEAQGDFPKQILNKLSNYVHLYGNNEDINVQTPEILKLIKQTYDKEVLPSAPNRIMSTNTIAITYFTEGRNHKLTLYVDQNWRLVEGPSQSMVQSQVHTNKEVAKLFGIYKNVLPLTQTPNVFNKNQFIGILQRLPLLNYLCSMENIESANIFIQLKTIKHTVSISSIIINRN